MKKVIEVSNEMKELIQEMVHSQVKLNYAVSKRELIRAKMLVEAEERRYPNFKWGVDDKGMIKEIYDGALLSEKEREGMDEEYKETIRKLMGQMEQNTKEEQS